ncbi:hypothetical protein TRVL_06131 [Trypanosoma vivax]|uniref:Uncharacterized protein n=1 Tax=Trypanosoma vivax (strain Y486) TaxID=1055687 RepID=G0TV45_TRYVY|nr:hypothetical protein TRVL_06131 [Trypanosoma vivax]CCC47811.1 conserved hypothetical protein [Trypanosoma vivax Y486]
MRRFSLDHALHWRLFCYSRRFLRKRKATTVSNANTTNIMSAETLRAGEVLAAPGTSLDSIREEILRMRGKCGGCPVGMSEKPSTPLPSQRLKNNGPDILIDTTRPSEVYYYGDDVIECVRAKDYVTKTQLFVEADEVLRAKNKENVIRYLQITHGPVGSCQRQEVKDAAKILLQKVECETQHVFARGNNALKENACPDENDLISLREGRLIGWVNVLTELNDEEIRRLWKWGLLDLDTVEYLLFSDEVYGELAAQAYLHDNETSESSGTAVSECGKQENGEDYSDSIPLESNIDVLQSIGELCELTATVSENVFMGFPNIDLAKVVQKVKKNQYDNISDCDLRLLEQYEEMNQVIRLPRKELEGIKAHTFRTSPECHCTTSGSSSRPNSSCADESNEHKRILSTSFNGNHVNDVPPSTLVESRSDHESNSPLKLDVTEAVMDRALCPSNHFLYAISRNDRVLRHSFECMERIKRHTLFDSSFQDAVKEVHKWQGISANTYLPKSNEVDTTKKNVCKHRRLRIAQRPVSLLGGPLAKPYRSSDVPYFYGNIRSFVPPRGRYNMATPKTSPGRHTYNGNKGPLRMHIRFSQ